jgi:hypothetical protein
MTKLGIVKLVINVAVGIGVSKVTNDVISNNVNVESTEDQIKVAIGSVVIGSMIAERASDHVNAKIDTITKIWTDRKATKTIEIVEVVTDNAA